MSPTLLDGEIVFSVRFCKKLSVKPRNLVIVKASSGFIVKRVSSVRLNSIFLQSDSLTETSIYCHRPLPKRKLVGRIIAAYSKAHGLRIFGLKSLIGIDSLFLRFKKLIG
ncbi:MAG: hypothetical protein CMQ54_00240 [Gammaproteobacteria bacterium]|nr:hypothetical protein [Gammaproteobacteria bacterium]|tara:strand:+ start:945 stop:1274 length:330 start_codon:yes stop_codon:yes gene_type:complete